jgi:hypothetical protein
MKLIIILAFLGMAVYGCNIKLDGRPGVSQSISDSKRREVFTIEYEVRYRPTGSDLPEINVTEAWVEKKWRFTKFSYDDTNIQEGYQLCFKVDKGSIQDLNSEWFIERKGSEAIGQVGEDRIWISDFDMMDTDSVFYKVFKGQPKLETPNSKPQGKLILIRKKEK